MTYANPNKQRASRLLDEVKAGIHHDEKSVNWALAVLGDLLGVGGSHE